MFSSPLFVRWSLSLALWGAIAMLSAPAAAQATYDDLLSLFEEWRAFEQPPLRDGAPDYTAATLEDKARGLVGMQQRLRAIDPSSWPLGQQVDWHLVRAEMNGLDFYLRVLRPWQRDPAFYTSIWMYQSDTPAHEGPVHHGIIEVWQYEFPLDGASAGKLTTELRTIPPLLTQARDNLTGNARELWQAGIGDLRAQKVNLKGLRERTEGTSSELTAAIDEAVAATASFVVWLEEQAPDKTEPSGIGREHYTWSLRNVHLVPMTWDEEVALLKRELDRAHASLALEEERNRQLPQLVAASTAEEYDARAQKAVTDYIAFLRDNDLMRIREYTDPALRAQVGPFVPEEERNFFRIAMHYDPTTLYTHFYHWWDLARMEALPHASPIRRGPLLYNIWDSRSEGLTTGVEEMFMHAGLYDDRPRVREIVWILLAQRAARGLGSLYVHANQMSMKEARDFHVRWTPRGWMSEELDLLGFEQLLYLRQPGYGSSYVTGKYLVERLLKDRRQQQPGLRLIDFLEEVEQQGVIPMSMIRWQTTGLRDEVDALLE